MKDNWCIRVKTYEPGDVIFRPWQPDKRAMIIRVQRDEWGRQVCEAVTEEFEKIIITNSALPLTSFIKHVPLDRTEEAMWADAVMPTHELNCDTYNLT